MTGGAGVSQSSLDDAAADAGALRALADSYGARAASLPPVALVIAAYNEEGAVGAVVEACRAPYAGCPPR
jgi:hypothetical protein